MKTASSAPKRKLLLRHPSFELAKPGTGDQNRRSSKKNLGENVADLIFISMHERLKEGRASSINQLVSEKQIRVQTRQTRRHMGASSR